MGTRRVRGAAAPPDRSARPESSVAADQGPPPSARREPGCRSGGRRVARAQGRGARPAGAVHPPRPGHSRHLAAPSERSRRPPPSSGHRRACAAQAGRRRAARSHPHGIGARSRLDHPGRRRGDPARPAPRRDPRLSVGEPARPRSPHRHDAARDAQRPRRSRRPQSRRSARTGLARRSSWAIRSAGSSTAKPRSRSTAQASSCSRPGSGTSRPTAAPSDAEPSDAEDDRLIG